VTRYRLAAGQLRLEPRELTQEERRLDVRHVFFVAQADHVPVLITPGVAIRGALRHAVKTQPPQPVIQLGIVRRYRTAFPSRAGHANRWFSNAFPAY
jgi:hypothetical protein